MILGVTLQVSCHQNQEMLLSEGRNRFFTGPLEQQQYGSWKEFESHENIRAMRAEAAETANATAAWGKK
jgi:hypothetical protein